MNEETIGTPLAFMFLPVGQHFRHKDKPESGLFRKINLSQAERLGPDHASGPICVIDDHTEVNIITFINGLRTYPSRGARPPRQRPNLSPLTPRWHSGIRSISEIE